MESKEHACPICKTKLDANPRYPNYVCPDCKKKACDINARKLDFWNTSIGGGFRAEYTDTKGEYSSHICYIDGIECYADEARFGGIVIEAKTNSE